MRWVIVIFIAIMVLTTAVPWLQKFGLGRLPGDINFQIFGKKIQIPLASTVLITVALLLIGKFL